MFQSFRYTVYASAFVLPFVAIGVGAAMMIWGYPAVFR